MAAHYQTRFEARAKSAHAVPGLRSLVDLDAYLAAVLNRARRFHEALDAVSDKVPPVTLLAIGGDCEETLNAPVIIRDAKRDRWLTLIRPQEFRTSTGARVTRRQAIAAYRSKNAPTLDKTN